MCWCAWLAGYFLLGGTCLCPLLCPPTFLFGNMMVTVKLTPRSWCPNSQQPDKYIAELTSHDNTLQTAAYCTHMPRAPWGAADLPVHCDPTRVPSEPHNTKQVLPN